MKGVDDRTYREIGGLRPAPKKRAESSDDVVHKLYIVNSKYPPSPIQEAECRIVITEKISWAEPIMPLRGALRTQKRFMLGAFAFYTRPQAVNKKLILLAQAMRAGPRHQSLANESWNQIENYKITGEVK